MEKGGRTKRIAEEFSGLRELGHEVRLVTFSDPPAWVREHYADSESWEVLPKTGGRVDLGLLRQLYKTVRQFRPDIIDAHCEGSAFYAGLVSRVTTSKSVATVHRSNLQYYTGSFKHRLFFGFVHGYVAVSEQRKALICSAFGVPESQVRVVHWGINVDVPGGTDTDSETASRRAALGVDDSPLLLSVGHLGPIKGHDDSIAALAMLQRQGRSARLYIAGDGDESDYQRLRKLVVELDLEHAVTLLGQVGNVQEWLQACDVFLQPSREEAFGLVFLEAGLAAKPTVATAVGGIPEIVEHGETGLLVPPEDPAAIAAAIEKLLGDREVAAAMGAAARTRIVENFSIEGKVGELVSYFETVVAA